MTFKEFLESGVKNEMFGDTPELDFAQDALRDKSFREFKKWDDLETYIIFRGADRAVVRAARGCFKLWQESETRARNEKIVKA